MVPRVSVLLSVFAALIHYHVPVVRIVFVQEAVAEALVEAVAEAPAEAPAEALLLRTQTFYVTLLPKFFLLSTSNLLTWPVQ